MVAVAQRLLAMGCSHISLGDTIGVGTANQAKQLVQALKQDMPAHQIALHFHDTYGQHCVIFTLVWMKTFVILTVPLLAWAAALLRQVPAAIWPPKIWSIFYKAKAWKQVWICNSCFMPANIFARLCKCKAAPRSHKLIRRVKA